MDGWMDGWIDGWVEKINGSTEKWSMRRFTDSLTHHAFGKPIPEARRQQFLGRARRHRRATTHHMHQGGQQLRRHLYGRTVSTTDGGAEQRRGMIERASEKVSVS